MVTATLPNGVTTSYVYDAAQRKTSIAHSYSGQTLASYTYPLDANGNRMRAVELVHGLTRGASHSPTFGVVQGELP